MLWINVFRNVKIKLKLFLVKFYNFVIKLQYNCYPDVVFKKEALPLLSRPIKALFPYNALKIIQLGDNARREQTGKIIQW